SPPCCASSTWSSTRAIPPRRGLLAGCAVAIGLFCTCRICCADEYEGPWSRKKREGCCSNCDCPSGCDCDGCCCPCD
ncbi:hypothetical protein ABT106_31400, partial [Streptomyces sp. NPDC002044]